MIGWPDPASVHQLSEERAALSQRLARIEKRQEPPLLHRHWELCKEVYRLTAQSSRAKESVWMSTSSLAGKELGHLEPEKEIAHTSLP